MVVNKTPPVIFIDDDGGCEIFFQHINAALACGAQSLFLLACDANGFTSAQLDEQLKGISVPVFGGVFPQILAGERKLERGSVVCGLPFPAMVYEVGGLSSPEEDYLLTIQLLCSKIPIEATLITLVDGLGKRISAFLESLYEVLGDDHPYIGGGAGSLSFQQKPCLFSNQGLLEDYAQITAIDLPVSIGIEHGWSQFAGPFFVTGARGNTITSLDYRPAFDVYREVVEADSGQNFEQTPFFDLVKDYPIGLVRLNNDMVVRDPLFHSDGSLTCVAEVPVNHMIYILKGDTENLLDASRRCILSVTGASGPLPYLALLFDCVSRVLFLQDRFQEEIDRIHSRLPQQAPLLGVLSLGEIADAGNACLEFFNKTIVLGIFTSRKENK